MEFGCAWYPEQWSPSRWPTDLQLMKAARMNTIRVGELAWSRLEPEEGQYDVEWLAQAIEAAQDHGLRTVITTPTAAPPAWLTERYPETLAVHEDGHRAASGSRHQFSPVSPRYRTLCAGIVEQLAMRFGNHRGVIAWQVESKHTAPSYDDITAEQFRAHLRREYQTLAHLNAHLATTSAGQSYTSWSQIPLPIGDHDPTLTLHFRRFCSLMLREYQHLQTEIIRRHSKHPITHGSTGWCDVTDHNQMTKEVDFASESSRTADGRLDVPTHGSSHDVVRGLRRKNFWLMEAQGDLVNRARVNNGLCRGATRTMAWQAIGHGADAVLYGQWRSARGGPGQYDGSLVSADGQPRPLYTEIAELGTDLEHASTALSGTRLETDCAILHGYDDRWALNLQRHHEDFDPVGYLQSFYRPLRRLLHTVDIVPAHSSISGYKVLVCPLLHLLDEELACSLSYFVGNGGHLILGTRSGMKDGHGSLWPQRQPGPLSAMLQAHVEEFFALDRPVPLLPAGEARLWAEWLQCDSPEVEVQLRYGTANGWLDGRAAVVSRRLGTGSITYVGGWFDDETMMTLAAGWATHSKLRRFPVPAGVEVGRRIGDQGECYVLINHTPTEQCISLPFAARDWLSALVHQDTLILGPLEVAVLCPVNP